MFFLQNFRNVGKSVAPEGLYRPLQSKFLFLPLSLLLSHLGALVGLILYRQTWTQTWHWPPAFAAQVLAF